MRNYAQRIARRRQLTEPEADGVALRAFESYFIVALAFRAIGIAEGEFVDQRRAEDVLVTRADELAQRLEGLTQQRPVGALARRNALRAGLRIVMRREREGDVVLRIEMMIELQGGDALQVVVFRFKDVVETPRRIAGVGQREDVEQRLPVRFNPILRNLAVGVRLPRKRVNNVGQRVVQIPRLRKIALSFQGRWHSYAPNRLRHDQRPELLVEKEEELVAVFVEVRAGNHNRPTDVVVPNVVAVARLVKPAQIAEEVVGVELLVAFEIRPAAVKLLRTRLGDDRDVRARHPPVLRLIVRQLYFDFGHGIHADAHHGIEIVADGVERDAVNRHVVRVVAIALRVEVEVAVQPFVISDLDYTGQQREE